MDTFIKGLRSGLPIGLGYFSVAIGFGLLCMRGGLSIGQAVLISMTNLTSAGQLAGVGVMFSAGSLFEMMTTQLVINMRYALMSVAMSQKIDEDIRLPHRFWIASFITDEIFAVSMAQTEALTKPFLCGLCILPYIGWAAGSLVGAVAGAALPDVLRNGMGILIYCMFLAILIPPAKESVPIRMVVVLSAACSCILHWLPMLRLSSGFSIIVCAVVASCYCAFRYPIKEAC